MGSFKTNYARFKLLGRARHMKRARIIGITQPPPKEGARNALFSNLSKSGLDNYVVERSERPLLEEVA